MGRRKADRIPRLLACDGIAVPAGQNVVSTLKELQCLIRLRSMGLCLEGNSVSILRMKYDASDRQKISKAADTRGGLLVFHDYHDCIREEKKRWRKKQVVIRELIAAACSNELFALIDLHKDDFVLLLEEEMYQLICAQWHKDAP